jgi:hypothetical protein
MNTFSFMILDPAWVNSPCRDSGAPQATIIRDLLNVFHAIVG